MEFRDAKSYLPQYRHTLDQALPELFGRYSGRHVVIASVTQLMVTLREHYYSLVHSGRRAKQSFFRGADCIEQVLLHQNA